MFERGSRQTTCNYVGTPRGMGWLLLLPRISRGEQRRTTPTSTRCTDVKASCKGKGDLARRHLAGGKARNRFATLGRRCGSRGRQDQRDCAPPAVWLLGSEKRRARSTRNSCGLVPRRARRRLGTLGDSSRPADRLNVTEGSRDAFVSRAGLLLQDGCLFSPP